MWHQIMYFLQILVIPLLLLFASKVKSSSESRMEGGIADETSMPPFKAVVNTVEGLLASRRVFCWLQLGFSCSYSTNSD